jgi:hypothetical protein
MSLNLLPSDLAAEYDWIRNGIGHNSEKRFNNPEFLNGSEVENKSATTRSSKRLARVQTG